MDKLPSKEDTVAGGKDPDDGPGQQDGAQQLEVDDIHETEDVLLAMPGKLFQFHEGSHTWGILATGEVKLTYSRKHIGTKIHFVTKSEHDQTIQAMHWVLSDTKLEAIVGTDRSWMWTTAEDLAGPTPTRRIFAVRFFSREKALEFQKVFDEVPKKDSSGRPSDIVEVKSQLEQLRIERDRIDQQIKLLEQQASDGAS